MQRAWEGSRSSYLPMRRRHVLGTRTSSRFPAPGAWPLNWDLPIGSPKMPFSRRYGYRPPKESASQAASRVTYPPNYDIKGRGAPGDAPTCNDSVVVDARGEGSGGDGGILGKGGQAVDLDDGANEVIIPSGERTNP